MFNHGCYNWLGNLYTTSGVYDSLLIGVNGCDSLVNIDLAISYSDTSLTSLTICDSYLWEGILYDVSGVYTNVYSNTSGCDSIAFLDLNIINTTAEIILPLPS